MISCDIVGNDCCVIVNVSPTLNLRSAHDFRNILSFFVKPGLCFKNGVREQIREVSVTFDANSMPILRQMKHIPPRGTTNRINIIPEDTPSLIKRNREASIRS